MMLKSLPSICSKVTFGSIHRRPVLIVMSVAVAATGLSERQKHQNGNHEGFGVKGGSHSTRARKKRLFYFFRMSHVRSSTMNS
jgi:hypothetical protein